MPDPTTTATPSADDLVRRKFWELADEKDALLAASQAKRDAREALSTEINALQEKKNALTEELRTVADARIFEIDNERGKLARILRDDGGKSQMGERPAKAG